MFGREKGEAQNDAEGVDTVKNLARNMPWLMKRLAVPTDNEMWEAPTEREGRKASSSAGLQAAPPLTRWRHETARCAVHGSGHVSA